MKKIRINELARELEVKPGVILDMLPELGVQEKKTHSSSIDEDVAIVVKQRLTGSSAPLQSSDRHVGPDENGENGAQRSAPHPPLEAHAAAGAAVPEPLQVSAISEQAAQPQRPTLTPLRSPARAITQETTPSAPPATPVTATPTVTTESEAPASLSTTTTAAGGTETPAPPAEHDRPIPVFKPIRPPLGGGGPLHPPVGPLTGQGSPGTPSSRTIAIPARPLPQAPAARSAPSTPLPSGPRQPLPSSGPRTQSASPSATPGAPLVRTPRPMTPPAAQRSEGSSPGTPERPASPRPPTHVIAPGGPASSVPGAPIQQARPQAPRPGLTPGAPIAPRPANRPLAGQPIARPTVPPRPDMVQRLKQQQTQQRPMPSAPANPRPAAPGRPAPAPGQPLYRGPIRPGQPLMRGPGGPGAPGQPGGLRRPGVRPMHPTALRPEAQTLPPGDPGRRHQIKPIARQGARKREDLEEGILRERGPRRQMIAEPPPIDREITVAEGITVKELSEKLGVKANLVIKKLVDTKKVFATINQTLDVKLAGELAREFGASTNQVSYEEESTQDIELAEENKDLVRRAPVVTIMGHVDHGKTSLLDAIRQTNVAGREAGGITQHIGAYYIEKNNRKIVFIDTPGHQAFTRMRARGAKVTDIVVLVVSADDGVMPQTLEAIDHARAAGVPIIVAINKIDKPDAQPERVKQQLADRNLLAEDWGGDVVMTPVSAKTGQNLDLLLEMILLVADIQDLKANPGRPALGTVLEAKLDKGRGPVATMLVRNGTLRTGDSFICGQLFSKVRAMFDDRGNSVKEAEPSMPVEVTGLESLPEVGDSFQVVSDTSKAKQIVLYRESKARDLAMAKGARVATLDSLSRQFKEGDLKDLNLIIKADVGGTAEVLSDTLQQLSNEKIRVRVLHTGVGAITESDVLLASASDAIIIGFNVRAERNAQAVADQQKLDIRIHSIIYELIDEVKLAMTGLLEPVFKEITQGHAEVRETFRISKVGTVAGCFVTDGAIRRDSQVRVLRDRETVHTGRIEALKRFKNDTSEVKNGLECGISLANFNNIQVGDIIEAFVMERIAVQMPEPTPA
ncbi:MAG TPA: translation initiation factor IF-2 [Bryobacteraceae bacterium]|nr:translation initiation factor IF-2 [Bryobacteraceae bacterium]